MKRVNFTADTRRQGVFGVRSLRSFATGMLFLSLLLSTFSIFAQTENPPAPGTPKSGTIPSVQEKKLGNNLTVAVVEKHSLPIVTVQLLVKSGASNEDASKAGLADLTASMLTKGTKTRSATQIAEAIAFLGGSINSGAGWNNSVVTISVTSDKLDQAMAIMADVVLNPAFDQKELDLLKSQTLDGLTYNLKQPSFLANYVASRYSFDEHPAGGTPTSIASITQSDVMGFHAANFNPGNAVLIFTGDISVDTANVTAGKYLGAWKTLKAGIGNRTSDSPTMSPDKEVVKRILVIDLPNSGQASVNYARDIVRNGRGGSQYYSSNVLNSLLGGGYSSRLNQEIRIKRGLSYGAWSSFAWRTDRSNFSASAQTKNESAAQVAELVLIEVKRLTDGTVPDSELTPRKSVLTGNFGRNLETTGGLAAAVADLYSFGIPTSELNSYSEKVNAIKDSQIRDFATQNLFGGDVIIVGDYAKFKDDLAKRFPNMKIDVIQAVDLDLSKDNLRK